MMQLKRRVHAMFSSPTSKLMLMLGAEGILIQFVGTLIGAGGFGCNLFATNLGATASQIGMTSLIANIAAMILLLPAGIIADRTKNAKTLPLVLALILGVSCILFGSIPMLKSYRIAAFFVLLPFTGGVLSIYNSIWQAFFGDVTPIEHRNRVYAFRNRLVYIVAIISPILAGLLLTAMPDADSKLRVMQILYYLCAAMNFAMAAILYHIPGGQRSPEVLKQLPKVSVRAVADVIRDLRHDRKFLNYFLPIALFYMAWHFDWSMWYIGQVEYVNMSEAGLSIYNAIISTGQLIALSLYVPIIERKGPLYSLLLPMVMLALCPAAIVISSVVPTAMQTPVMILTGFITIAPMGALNLCLVQLLLQAAPEKNRSLVVSLNMVFVTLSNGVMTFVGVQIYNLFGGNFRAFVIFNIIAFLFRGAVAVMYIFKYRRENKIQIT